MTTTDATVSAGIHPEQAGRIAMITLGCAKNLVDSEVMLGGLLREGYSITEDPRDADVVLVNTCSFIEAAKTESIETILKVARLKETGRLRGLFVTGCMAQRYADDLARELPEVDGIIGFAHYPRLAATIRRLLDSAPPNRIMVGDATVPFQPEWGRKRLTPRHTAFLRVAEGCDHQCTFCAIPGFRGRFRSKPWDDILDEAKRLADSGVREFNLIAEDTNQYGQDVRDGRNLSHLLEALAAVPGVDWIRILYAYPSYFGDDLIEAIAGIPEVCPYIDIPLQHIADPVLKRMRRPSEGMTVNLLEKLRARIPGLALRTTFISGFPGETDSDHRELLAFVESFRFERLGVFAYSTEDGTPAAGFDGMIPEQLRQDRADEIMAAQQEVAFQFAASLIGRTMPVLVDKLEDKAPVGRTPLDAPDVDPVVYLPAGQGVEPGDLVSVEITGSVHYDLEAILVGAETERLQQEFAADG